MQGQIAWLDKGKAKIFLAQWLHETSATTELSFTKVSIRDQKTRWGSCTPKKHINLNYKLIFLPAALAQHVLIHELCHTIHLNHSRRFWALVARHDPDYKMLDKALRKADQYIPKCWDNRYE